MIYEVGKQVAAPGGDMVVFDMAAEGATLQLRMSSPTAKEKRDFKEPAQFKVTMVEDVVFILIRFGAGPWMDAPYNIHLSRPFALTPVTADEGIPVHALLIDAKTGILAAQRVVSMTPETSYALLQLVDVQPDLPDYSDRVRGIYARYTTEDLLRLAVV